MGVSGRLLPAFSGKAKASSGCGQIGPPHGCIGAFFGPVQIKQPEGLLKHGPGPFPAARHKGFGPLPPYIAQAIGKGLRPVPGAVTGIDLGQTRRPDVGRNIGMFKQKSYAKLGIAHVTGGIAHEMLAVYKKIGQAVAHTGRHKTAPAAKSLKNPEIQIPVFAVVQQHTPLRKKLPVVAPHSVQAGKPLAKAAQKIRAPGHYRRNGTHKKAVPHILGMGIGLILLMRKRRRPPHMLLLKKRARKTRKLIAQRHKADVKGLGIKGLPAMDMRINTVMDREAGEIFHPEHKGRLALVSHNQHIRLKTRKAHQIMPAIHTAVITMVQGHVLPAAGAKFCPKKRAAQP